MFNNVGYYYLLLDEQLPILLDILFQYLQNRISEKV